MKRIWAAITVLGLAGALVAGSGCAKKQETGGTSTDSTLSLGEVSKDVPPAASPASGEAYQPGQATTTTTTTTTTRSATPPPARRPTSTASPTPRTASVTLPAGTQLSVAMDAEVSTKDKAVGDTFTAKLADDVVADGKVVLPAGSVVTGHVVESVRPGKIKGRGRLVLAYDSVEANGKTYPLDITGPVIEGKSGTAGDAVKVVGGAAAGAILSKVLGGSAGKGAAIGAAAGGAAAIATRGPDPKVEAGTKVTISTDKPITVKSGV